MADTGFYAMPHGSLSAAGLGTDGARVDYATGGLVLKARSGEMLDVPWTSLSRVRVGFYEPKYGSNRYRVMLWTNAAPRPLLLTALSSELPAFAGIVRSAALRTFNACGPGSLEGGLGWRDALGFPLAMAGAMVLAFLAATNDPAIHHGPGDALDTALLMLGMTVVIETALFVFFVRPYRPRKLSGMDDIEAFLPRPG
jgi:hypothetical protein